MKLKILAAALWPAFALTAQTAQTTLFRAVMQASTAAGDSGAADVVAHVVRDASNHILSGAVDFDLNYQFPGDEVVTGLAIVNAQSGAVALATGISAAAPVQATAGSGRIYLQLQAPA